MSDMTPREIVHELDQHIIGQAKAKKRLLLHFVTAGAACN